MKRRNTLLRRVTELWSKFTKIDTVFFLCTWQYTVYGICSWSPWIDCFFGFFGLGTWIQVTFMSLIQRFGSTYERSDRQLNVSVPKDTPTKFCSRRGIYNQREKYNQWPFCGLFSYVKIFFTTFFFCIVNFAQFAIRNKKKKIPKNSFSPRYSLCKLVCNEKTRGLYHVFEGRYLNFSSHTFLKILVIHTAPTVGTFDTYPVPLRNYCNVPIIPFSLTLS